MLNYSQQLLQYYRFCTLDYPDGSQAVVWLPDDTIEFFCGKHIALGIAIICIILVGVPYTMLLISGSGLSNYQGGRYSSGPGTQSSMPLWTPTMLHTTVFVITCTLLQHLLCLESSSSILTTIILVGGLILLKRSC